MIKSIKIKNFQSHIKTILNFVPGINCIIGQSDSGKTSILKAINWIINNKPVGNSFITHKKDDCSVTLNTKEDIIIREKGKNTNKYIINNIELEAFKNDIPDSVKTILNFSKLNIQNQHDKPFLLNDSSGEVAKTLNKVINLDIIDKSLFNIEKMRKNYKLEYNKYSNDITIVEKELDHYVWIEKAEKQLNILIDNSKNLENKEKQFSQINILFEKKRTYSLELSICNETLVYEKEINLLLRKEQLLQEKETQYNQLDEIIEKRNNFETEIFLLNKIIKYNNLIKELIKKQEILQKKTNNFSKLNNFILKNNTFYKNLTQITIELKKSNKEYLEIKPNICPLCGGEYK